jgi:hypothetical protein
MTPEEVIDKRRQAVVARSPEDFANLFAEDGVMEMPFAPLGSPSQVKGREAIRQLATITMESANWRVEELEMVMLHRTEDPEVVIVELITRGTATETGAAFAIPCIQVFRIGDGQIKLFRDYAGPSNLS